MNLPKVLLKFIRETFKVAALKCIKPSTSKTIKEMQSSLELSKVLFKFVSESFLKVAALKRRSVRFVELPLQTLLRLGK